jgi:hypothetical protein
MGKGLSKGLRLRTSARYKPNAKLKIEDAKFVISLAEGLLSFCPKGAGMSEPPLAWRDMRSSKDGEDFVTKIQRVVEKIGKIKAIN